MLLTACTSHSSTQQRNMRSFSSSRAINPAHVLAEEVNKCTRKRKAINFCLVLAPLGKFNTVNCPLFIRNNNNNKHTDDLTQEINTPTQLTNTHTHTSQHTHTHNTHTHQHINTKNRSPVTPPGHSHTPKC